MAKVLIVDDSLTDCALTSKLLVTRPSLGDAVVELSVLQAHSADEAIQMIRKERVDVVLTDLVMPDKSGLDLVVTLRQDYPSLPIVLMTGQGNEDIAYQALQAGAAGYVPKRHLAQDLFHTVQNLLEQTSEKIGRQRVLGCLAQTDSNFVLQNDRSLVVPLTRHVEEVLRVMGTCDENESIRVGIALREALLNAINHGNLEMHNVSREDDEEAFFAIVEERRQRWPYRDRRVHVRTEHHRDEVVLQVRNEGPGFDVTKVLQAADPSNIGEQRGRGLMLIYAFMDEVSFNEDGTELTMIKHGTD